MSAESEWDRSRAMIWYRSRRARVRVLPISPAAPVIKTKGFALACCRFSVIAIILWSRKAGPVHRIDHDSMGFAAPSIASTCQLHLPAPPATCHLPPATPNRHLREGGGPFFFAPWSIDALIKCSERGRHTRTRREYVPIGSGAASMLRTVREYLTRPPLCETGSVGKQHQAAT